MSEELLETTELHHQLHGHGEGGDSPAWLLYLSLTTAIIAVFAAIASLQAGALSNDALLEKNEALLYQSRASDQWSFYQAKGIKSAIAGGQAIYLASSQPEAAQRAAAEQARYKAEQEEIQTKAKELEQQIEEHNHRSEHFLEQHHRCAMAVTMFQIAIALGAIAALARRRLLWLGGLGCGALGLGLAIWGMFLT